MKPACFIISKTTYKLWILLKKFFIKLGVRILKKSGHWGFSFCEIGRKKKKSKQIERILTLFGEIFKMDRCLKFMKNI